MYRSIAWATDGSEHSDRALTHAVALAAEMGASLHAIHVTERLLAGRAAGQYVRVDEEQTVDKIKRQLTAAGVSTSVTAHWGSTLDGPVAKVIAQIADEAGADLLVIGTRGHGSLAGLATGSVAQHLLHDAHCPVLAIGPSAGAAFAPQAAGATALTDTTG